MAVLSTSIPNGIISRLLKKILLKCKHDLFSLKKLSLTIFFDPCNWCNFFVICIMQPELFSGTKKLKTNLS